jgi:hypothetical protein
MDRGEELMDLNRAAFDRNTRAYERVIEALDRHEEMFEENKIFIRDLNRRSEKVVQRLVRDNEEFMSELRLQLRARDEGADRRTEAIVASLNEASEESKAHRQALLALIDRIPPPQGA